MLETFERPEYSKKTLTFEQKEFCDIGLVVTLGERCKLCQRKVVRADCEHWLAKTSFKPYSQYLRYGLIFVGLIVGIAFIAIFNRVFASIPSLEYVGTILFGKIGDDLSFGTSNAVLPPYPFTIQNLSLLIFFAGMGEIFFRGLCIRKERQLLDGNFLPQTQRAVLDIPNLAQVRRGMGDLKSEDQGFLFILIDLCTKRFMNSESIEQTLNALRGKLELLSHKLDIRYTFIRYLIWVIPTIGFIGTVLGISFAILGINPANINLEAVIASLGVAFHTTLVALVLSALLTLFYNIILSSEEDVLNRAGNYVLNNMVNRLDPSLDVEQSMSNEVLRVPTNTSLPKGAVKL